MTNEDDGIDRDLVVAWVDALRSGEYRQRKNYLAGPDWEGKLAYCCLGVACEVAISTGYAIKKVADEDGYVEYDDEREYVPADLRTPLGLQDSEGGIEGSEFGSLANMNDNLSYSFADIANVIERYILRPREASHGS